jgi:lysophospholipase L1-like esterase
MLHRVSRRSLRPVLALLAVALAGAVLARYVAGVGAASRSSPAVVVAFGDSLTEGGGFTRRPWPEVLAERLRQQPRTRAISVANAGISGNRLLREGFGPSGLRRFDPDVLARRGVRWVIVLIGINDLGYPGSVEREDPRVTAEQLIEAYRRLIAQAHAAGVKIHGGTLLPFEGTDSPGYHAADKEQVRQAVNAWIRTSSEFDGVVDFDLATRDPRQPARLLGACDSGDHLHPNDAGHRAMGEAVDLALFQSAN